MHPMGKLEHRLVISRSYCACARLKLSAVHHGGVPFLPRHLFRALYLCPLLVACRVCACVYMCASVCRSCSPSLPIRVVSKPPVAFLNRASPPPPPLLVPRRRCVPLMPRPSTWPCSPRRRRKTSRKKCSTHRPRLCPAPDARFPNAKWPTHPRLAALSDSRQPTRSIPSTPPSMPASLPRSSLCPSGRSVRRSTQTESWRRSARGIRWRTWRFKWPAHLFSLLLVTAFRLCTRCRPTRIKRRRTTTCQRDKAAAEAPAAAASSRERCCDRSEANAICWPRLLCVQP